MQECHNILHDVLMVDNGFLKTDYFLQQHRVVDAKLVVALLQGVQLSLCCHQLSADHVHLLRRQAHLFGVRRVGFARRGCFSSNVVERVFVVHLEVGVLEFPSLSLVSSGSVKSCRGCTNSRAVLGLTILLIVMSHFVEVIFVQLANKTGEVAVFEMLRKDVFRELLVLRNR